MSNSNDDSNTLCLNDIGVKPITWLWRNRIAIGKLTVIAGDPGLGKSQIMAGMAGVITSGQCFPDGTRAPMGSVLFLSAEDDPQDTITPRFIAAGADLRKCHVLKPVQTQMHNGKMVNKGFDLANDIARLETALQEMGDAKLVVIDPVTAYLGKIDGNSNPQMRGALSPLADLAARYNVAVLMVTHLSKDEKRSMIGRVSGSIALIAASRAGYAVIKGSKDDLRYLLPIKNNLGDDTNGFAFTIEEVDLGTGITTSRVVWQDGEVEAKSILSPQPPKKQTLVNEIAEWLQAFAGKKVLASAIYEEGLSHGYNASAIDRAARMLNVIRRKQAAAHGAWEWEFPGLETPKEIKDSKEVEDVYSDIPAWIANKACT